MNRYFPCYAGLLLSLGMITAAHGAPSAKRANTSMMRSHRVDPVDVCIRQAMHSVTGVAEVGRLHCGVDRPGASRSAGVYLADANGVYVSGVAILYGAHAFIVRKMEHGRWMEDENQKPAAPIDRPLQWIEFEANKVLKSPQP